MSPRVLELSAVNTLIPNKCLLAEQELKETQASRWGAMEAGEGGEDLRVPATPDLKPSAFCVY